MDDERFPEHYEPERAGALYVERGQQVAEEAARWAHEQRVEPAAGDTLRVAAFGIDCQVGFCHPDASLFVPGAVEDTARVMGWLYRNLGQITQLFFSLDTHELYQVFHPAFWRDEAGRPPAPLTVITADEIERGRWLPQRGSREQALEYARRLQEAGRYELTIWPFHTLLGGTSHALMPALMEAAIFHGVARGQGPELVMKGRAAETENYSVFAPEVLELGGQQVGCFEEALFERLMSFDRIYVFGQASSHCVLSTVRDWLERLEEQGRPEEAARIHLLIDATSPVPAPPLDPLPEALDFPRQAHLAQQRFAEAGVKLVRTSDDLVADAEGRAPR